MNIYNKQPVNISLTSQFTKHEKNAQIRVICGPMFSGKTTTLINFIDDYKTDEKTVLVFKPMLDNRYGTDKIMSHDNECVEAIEVSHPKQILDYIMQADVMAIDEVQFFDESIVKVCEILVENGKTCLISGLDLDYKAKPFGSMPQILTIADEIIKLNAVCTSCNGHARYTHRLSQELDTVVLGEKDKYTALCRSCYHKNSSKLVTP